MRWLIAAALAATLVSCGKAPAPTATAPGGGGTLTWLHSLDEALAQAKSSGKPVLVDFWHGSVGG